MTVKFSGEVHPVAALFPMLAEDELEDLAADIETNGLLHPIVIDDGGRLLDGRNRLAACERVGVEPAFNVYDGDDPDAYCLSVNIARRHMTKGQRTMVAAKANRIIMIRQSTRQLAASNGLSHSQLGHANVVLDFAPDLVDPVIVGATPLDAAYKTAMERKKAGESDEALMAKLRFEHPDLAELVKEERLSLSEALRTAGQRDADRAKRVKVNTTAVVDAIRWAALLDQPAGRAMAAELFDANQCRDMFAVDRAAIKRAAENLTALAKEWPDR